MGWPEEPLRKARVLSTKGSIELFLLPARNTLEVGLAEVGPQKIGPEEVGPDELGAGEVGSGEVCPRKVSPGEVATTYTGSLGKPTEDRQCRLNVRRQPRRTAQDGDFVLILPGFGA